MEERKIAREDKRKGSKRKRKRERESERKRERDQRERKHGISNISVRADGQPKAL